MNRLAGLLLQWRLGGRAREIVQDLDELRARRAAAHGPAYARRRYVRDVLSFLIFRHPDGKVWRGDDHSGRAYPMSSLMFDLRQVFRAVSRRPGFFTVASLTLAVGCAAHLSAFTLLDRMLLAAPPHVADAGRVFRLHIERADRRDGGRFLWFQTPYRAFEDIRQIAGPFEAMSAYRPVSASVGSGADARQIALVYADEHYFPLLGASPQIGRVFDASENRPSAASPVLVLSDTYWGAAYGRDPSVVGRTLRVGASTYTIIGIMPPRFNGDTPETVDAWAPLHAGAAELPATWMTAPLMRSVTPLVRLAPGVDRATAAEQTAAGYRRAVEGTPAADPTARILLASLNPGRMVSGEINQAGRIAVWIQGVALLVLLVAVANVVNLQMSRAVQMRRELAVRVALGAGPARLAFALCLEMLVISAAAVALATLLTWGSATTLLQVLLPTAPAAIDVWRVAMMTGGTLLGTTLVCLGFSMLQLRIDRVAERLKSGRGGEGFGRERLRQGLLVVQVVVSVLLLVGAGLFLRSVDRLGRLQFGHDHERVIVVTSPLRGAGYPVAAIEAFYERAVRELPLVAGVEQVAAAQSTPFAPSQSADIYLPGLERLPLEPRQFPTFYTVTPRYFAAMGMSILRGRGFTDEDRAQSPPVMILEDALARALFPGAEALGRCVIVGAATDPCRTVVGIASNTRRFVTLADGALRYYVPMTQRVYTATPQALFVRTAGNPSAAMPSVRAALLNIDPNLPHVRMRTLTEMAEPEKRPWRLGSTLFVVYGAAALLVSTMGVYALLSFIVTQRSREIGVRLALGASPGRTRTLIVRQSIVWVIAGLIAGVAIAAGAGKFIRPLLFETSPYDATVFAGAALVLLVVGVAASLAPAVRASRVDPNVALRAE